MRCTRNIANDVVWVGVDSRRLAFFEGVYKVPRGISYNSYLLLDEKTVLFDTVEQDVSPTFMENLESTLGDRPLDYIVIHHMEPDHSATILDVLNKYPGAMIVCNEKTESMIEQFFDRRAECLPIKDGDTLSVGAHTLRFLFAPMVHWPEVMMTLDESLGILFSADAFGTFGALNGAIFADEVDFDRDYLDEARRYYCNIVGKYGSQVQSALKKLSSFNIKMIAPLHGFVWRENTDYYINKYTLWSSYTPEVSGVMIAYSSIYGNTELAANILACRLKEQGIPLAMYDTTVTDHSHVLAEAFKYSHLIFASPTYNGGVFSTMDSLLREIAKHNLKGRTIAFIENGTWSPMAAKKMREILSPLGKNTFIDQTLVIKSALRDSQREEIENLAKAICESIKQLKMSTDRPDVQQIC